LHRRLSGTPAPGVPDLKPKGENPMNKSSSNAPSHKPAASAGAPAKGGHRGDMTVSEAGHKGGQKGGQRVRELVAKGRQADNRGR